LVGSAIRESASRIRSGPFAVPFSDQKAGVVWLKVMVVVQALGMLCCVRVNGT